MDVARKPIYSTRDEQDELREALDEFVVRLAERIDLLQDAESAADLAQLGALAQALGEDAEKLGYPALRELTDVVRRTCLEDKPDAAHEALAAATDVARRIRLGHRGAF